MGFVPRQPLRSQRSNSRTRRAPHALSKQEVSVAPPEKTVIVGGGPAGLATAIALAQKGWKDIRIYDRLHSPPDPDDQLVWSDTARFYLIGLGGRGQKALGSLGLWEDVKRYTIAVNGRKDWAPGAGPEEGVLNMFSDRPYVTQVLARDRLVGIMLRAIQQRYDKSISVHYGVDCMGVRWTSDGAGKELSTLQLKRRVALQGESRKSSEVDEVPFEESTCFLIGADGASRAIARALESNHNHQSQNQRIHVKQYVDDNVRVYKSVPMKAPKDWLFDINYSSRSKDGRVVFDALPADEDGNYCGVLLLREHDPLANPNTSASELRSLLDEYVPQFSALVTDDALQLVAKRPPSRLPKFSFVGPCLHRGNSTVLLGDAVHTVKPYFGLGANSALEDVMCFSAVLDAAGNEIAPALRNFTRLRAKEAHALVRVSRALDRPGRLGVVTFIVPLLLDIIFNKLAPWLFAPNIISMLQLDGMTFSEVARRKRRDRVLQMATLGAAAMLMKHIVAWISRSLLRSVKLPMVKRAGASFLFAAFVSVVFVPKFISMLQLDGMTFSGVARRKRVVHSLQIATVGLVGLLMKYFSLRFGKPVGAAAFFATVICIAVVRWGVTASKDMAPADVLAKAGGEIVPKADHAAITHFFEGPLFIGGRG